MIGENNQPSRMNLSNLDSHIKNIDKNAAIKITSTADGGSTATQKVLVDGRAYTVKTSSSAVMSETEAKEKIDQTINKLLKLTIILHLGSVSKEGKFESLGLDSQGKLLMKKNGETYLYTLEPEKMLEHKLKLASMNPAELASYKAAKRENRGAVKEYQKEKLSEKLSELQKTKSLVSTSPTLGTPKKEPHVDVKTSNAPIKNPALMSHTGVLREHYANLEKIKTLEAALPNPSTMPGVEKTNDVGTLNHTTITEENNTLEGPQHEVVEELKTTTATSPILSEQALKFKKILEPFQEFLVTERAFSNDITNELAILRTMLESGKFSKDKKLLQTVIDNYSILVNQSEIMLKKFENVAKEYFSDNLQDKDQLNFLAANMDVKLLEQTFINFSKLFGDNDFKKLHKQMENLGGFIPDLYSFKKKYEKVLPNFSNDIMPSGQFTPEIRPIQRLMRYGTLLEAIKENTRKFGDAGIDNVVNELLVKTKKSADGVNYRRGIPDHIGVLLTSIQSFSDTYIHPKISELNSKISYNLSNIDLLKNTPLEDLYNTFDEISSQLEEMRDHPDYDKFKKGMVSLSNKISDLEKLTGQENPTKFARRKMKELEQIVNTTTDPDTLSGIFKKLNVLKEKTLDNLKFPSSSLMKQFGELTNKTILKNLFVLDQLIHSQYDISEQADISMKKLTKAFELKNLISIAMTQTNVSSDVKNKSETLFRDLNFFTRAVKEHTSTIPEATLASVMPKRVAPNKPLPPIPPRAQA